VGQDRRWRENAALQSVGETPLRRFLPSIDIQQNNKNDIDKEIVFLKIMRP
jgi:hypothetical protein